jgi:hypothetical protein
MRQSQKLISSIRDDGEEYKGQIGVMKCVKNFYKSLYKNKPRSNPINDTSFYDKCPKLSEQNKTFKDQELTINDLKESLSSCKTSSPGPDGIPYKIYKTI